MKAKTVLRKCSICKVTHNADDLDGCPCGFKVCDECQDYGIYADEVCCKRCAAEIRKAWAECKRHKFDKPYENEDGVRVKECQHCGLPRIAEGK